MNKVDFFKIKAEVLCWGLKTNNNAEEIYQIQHPTHYKRTGNTGLHIILENGLIINSIYGEKFCENSPYSIKKSNQEFWLYKNEKPACKISVINAPKWYRKKTKNGALMSEILLQEGKDTLITSIENNCCYFQKNTQCKFCILGYQKGSKQKNINQLVETVLSALEENPNYHLHLTGGNTFTRDNGIKYYKEYVKAIRKESDIPITLEISPSQEITDIDDIIADGANGFSINIEIWDENKRHEICPGKSKINRKLYFDSWKRATNLLGRFKTSSVMLIGLDKPENIEKGIEEMINFGIKPVLIPFRPFSMCALNNLNPPDPLELIRLSEIVGYKLTNAGAKKNDLVGCERCGACTMEKDFMKK